MLEVHIVLAKAKINKTKNKHKQNEKINFGHNSIVQIKHIQKQKKQNNHDRC